MSNNLVTVLQSDLFNNPWSIYLDGEFIPGKKNSLPKICKNCASKDCLTNGSQEICYKQMKSKKGSIGEHRLVIPGIGNTGKNKGAVTQKFSDNSYGIWSEEIINLNDSFEHDSLKLRSETLHYFHDPVKWAEQIKISSEKIIERIPEKGFKEKYESASHEIKSIYQSAKLLVDSIQMIHIFFNPESATYGTTVNTNIYKMFDKIQAILFHSEGKKYNKRFRLSGRSFQQIHLYESFPIVALALTHNALKYSKNNEIDIIIEDSAAHVDVQVVSIGPLIGEVEKSRVFEKGYRGEAAKQLHHDGSGMGLYVAQHIAKLHGFKIHVSSECLKYENGGVGMAKNTFSFSLPTVGVS